MFSLSSKPNFYGLERTKTMKQPPLGRPEKVTAASRQQPATSQRATAAAQRTAC